MTIPEASPAHLELAGMALAHAVWSIEYGETLCTMAMLRDDDGRFLSRYETDTIEESVEEALADLHDRLTAGAFAALVYDGYYTDDGGVRTDALIVELVAANMDAEGAGRPAHLGRIVQRYNPGGRRLLRRSRAALVGLPVTQGHFPADAVELIVSGALKHEKVRELFRAA